MAIDFLILCLLLLSLTINVLALGAFWVTPGLRTTANRFVINLLIVNIIGCLALAPTLFLRSNSYSYETIDQTTIYRHHQSADEHRQYAEAQADHESTRFLHRFNWSGRSMAPEYEEAMKRQNDARQRLRNDAGSNIWKIITSTTDNVADADFNRISRDNKNFMKRVAEETMIRCVGKLCEKITVDEHTVDAAEYEDAAAADVDVEVQREARKNSLRKSSESIGSSGKIGSFSSTDESSVDPQISGKSDTSDSSVDDSGKTGNHKSKNIRRLRSRENNHRNGGVDLSTDSGVAIDSDIVDVVANLEPQEFAENSQYDAVVDDEFISEPSDEPAKHFKHNTDTQVDRKDLLHIQSDIRCWSLDLVAALSALSVLLIVGDTWCAITDPLRYHSRISGLKAWLLIAVIWFLAIFFGILSALRETTLTSETVLKQHRVSDYNRSDAVEVISASMSPFVFDGFTTTDGYALVQNSTFRSANGTATFEMVMFGHENLYNMIYSCLYFIVIILAPFGLVCCMYWRIFSEARENGLRMRQNGSSPLLQSALNLAQHNSASQGKNQYAHKSSSHNHICINPIHHFNASTMHLNKDELKIDSKYDGGLQMRIDNIEAKKPLLLLQNSSTETSNRESSSPEKTPQKDKNQNNILLTLSRANDELKRNYSTRQLALLDLDEHEFEIGSNGVCRTGGSANQINKFAAIRQVHSTPNFQRYQKRKDSDDSLSDIDLTTTYVMGQNLNIHHPHRISFSRTQSTTHCGDHANALQLPNNIHNTSPRALSYMTSIRHRLSNASSLFKYREESRAARISILVVIMFLVSYLPYGILVLLQGRIFSLSSHATQLAVFVVLLGNLGSPIIFAYRNKRVRRGVKRLFNLDPRAKDRQLQRRGIDSTTSPSHHQQQHDQKIRSNITGFFLRSSASNFHLNSSKKISNNNNSCKKNNNNSNINNNNSCSTNNNNSSKSSKKEKCGAKPSINITANKMSAYTLNTCKFLSPSIAANAASSLLIDLEKCHYLKKKKNASLSTASGNFIKISKVKRNSSKPIVQEEEDINEDNFVEQFCEPKQQQQLQQNCSVSGAGHQIGVLHDPIEIIISDNSVANQFIQHHKNNCNSSNNLNCSSNNNSSSSCSNEKRSILKIVCDSSRKLGCANGESCASSDYEIEPTDV